MRCCARHTCIVSCHGVTVARRARTCMCAVIVALADDGEAVTTRGLFRPACSRAQTAPPSALTQANGITRAGARDLASCLLQGAPLRALSLRDNVGISEEGICAIAAALPMALQIQQIDFSGITISADTATALSKAAASQPSLTALGLTGLRHAPALSALAAGSRLHNHSLFNCLLRSRVVVRCAGLKWLSHHVLSCCGLLWVAADAARSEVEHDASQHSSMFDARIERFPGSPPNRRHLRHEQAHSGAC